eukprot:scaffold1681_cov242-Prasinococcus_capsulatus_cf.AAC.8
MSEAKPSTSACEEGFSTRKKFFSSKLEQMASTHSAIRISTTPIGLKVGTPATSPRVNRMMPATSTATDRYSAALNFLPLITVAKIITGTTLADLNTMRVAYARNLSA